MRFSPSHPPKAFYSLRVYSFSLDTHTLTLVVGQWSLGRWRGRGAGPTRTGRHKSHQILPKARTLTHTTDGYQRRETSQGKPTTVNTKIIDRDGHLTAFRHTFVRFLRMRTLINPGLGVTSCCLLLHRIWVCRSAHCTTALY